MAMLGANLDSLSALLHSKARARARALRPTALKL